MIQFGIISKTEAHNENLRVEVLNLGESKADKAPPVHHFAVSESTAKKVDTKLKGNQMRKISPEWKKPPIQLEVESPEDAGRTRYLRVEVIVVPQTVHTARGEEMKGKVEMNEEDINQISECCAFGSDDCHPDVDLTLVLGQFSETESLSFLLYRPTWMIKGSLTDEEASAMYNWLRQIAGENRGFELRRNCGSSGLVDRSSDANITRILAHLHSAIPRKLWGCLLVRGKYQYYIVYKRAKGSGFTYVWYSPPHEGGRFSMPIKMMEECPILGEFSYVKMLAVKVIESYNCYRVNNQEAPISVGPVSNESRNIEAARKHYNPNEEGAMLKFVHAYNCMNDFNMLCHPVGVHKDHYPGKVGFENKLPFVNHYIKNNKGRGGALFENQHCVCIVDWQAADKEAETTAM